MMSYSMLNVRVDTEDKKRFNAFCSDMGMNASVAVNMFVKAVLRENRLPFEIRSADPFYSAENTALLERRAEDMRAGRRVGEHELIEAE